MTREQFTMNISLIMSVNTEDTDDVEISGVKITALDENNEEVDLDVAQSEIDKVIKDIMDGISEKSEAQASLFFFTNRNKNMPYNEEI